MKNISFTDMRAILEDLLNENMSREEAANWASGLREAEDRGKLEYHPKDAESALWEAILFIGGIDLQSSPDTYLHSKEDIRIFIKELESLL